MITKLYNRIHQERKYPLLAVLALGIAFSSVMLVARVMISGEFTFLFLAWNLFLAFIPIGFALLLNQSGKRRFGLFSILSFLGWLAFFPNAPYILTDLFHLKPRGNVPEWYDLLLILSFAWTALIAGYFSLMEVQEWVKRKFSGFWSWIVVLFVLLAGSFGVYMGRFLRWNSWDLISHPMEIVKDVAAPVLHPFENMQAVGMTLGLFGFLLMGYFTIMALTGIRVRREPVQSVKTQN